MSDAVLTRCISVLRKAFDDDPKAPRVIETIPKRGYRLLERVEPVDTSRPRIEYVASWFQRVHTELAPRKSWTLLAALMGLTLLVASVESLPRIARFYKNRGARLQQPRHLEEAVQTYRFAIFQIHMEPEWPNEAQERPLEKRLGDLYTAILDIWERSPQNAEDFPS